MIANGRGLHQLVLKKITFFYAFSFHRIRSAQRGEKQEK